MRHVLRLNVAEQGYSLYSADRRGLRAEPLDIASETVPRDYLGAQRRLDAFFASSEGPWSMTFRSMDDGGCVVAYGCKIADVDQRGRRGLVLVHAILLESPRELTACVLGLLTLLSPTRVGLVTQAIADVAQGRLGVQKVLEWLIQEVDLCVSQARALPSTGSTRGEISEIVHDCAGAAPLAWLAFASQQSTARHPWEVYDALSSQGEPSSRLGASSGQPTAASRVLARLILGDPQTVSRRPPQAPEPVVVPPSMRTVPPPAPVLPPDKPADESEAEATGSRSRWLILGASLVGAIALLLAGRALGARPDLGRQTEDSVLRIVREAEQSVSSIQEARSEALTEMQDQADFLRQQLEGSLRVAVSPEAPPTEGCDAEHEQGRISVQHTGQRALLYVCAGEKPAWVAIGQTESKPPTASRQAAQRPRGGATR